MNKKLLLTRRRNFLFGLGAFAGMGTFTTASRFRHLNSSIQADADADRNATTNTAPLRAQAAAKGLIYGAASTYPILSSNPAFANLFAQQCAMLVPENELKWKALRPSPNRFNFTRGDWMAEFAREHGMLFRGHNFVWHRNLPEWFAGTVNSQNAEQILLKHIATVAGHYAGRVHSWDVVNEAIDPKDKRSNGLRNSPWLKFLGPDYIDIAFRAAAEADPQALLVYNDYGLDYDTPQAEAKRTAVLRLLERLKSNGTPVHALGMQTHLGENSVRAKFKGLRKFLSDVANLGLNILITEMDISDRGLPRDSVVRDRIVAGVYEDYLSVVLDEPAVIAVVTWGLSDRYTWLSQEKPREDGAPVRPLLFDAKLKPKLAWNAVARAFEQAPVRDVRLRLPTQTALQDVEGHWAQAYIEALASKNIISGFPDGTFRPNAPVTRAEFATIVTKAFTPAQQNNSAVIEFQDVPPRFWGYDAIQTSAKIGFLVGYPG